MRETTSTPWSEGARGGSSLRICEEQLHGEACPDRTVAFGGGRQQIQIPAGKEPGYTYPNPTLFLPSSLSVPPPLATLKSRAWFLQMEESGGNGGGAGGAEANEPFME